MASRRNTSCALRPFNTSKNNGTNCFTGGFCIANELVLHPQMRISYLMSCTIPSLVDILNVRSFTLCTFHLSGLDTFDLHLTVDYLFMCQWPIAKVASATRRRVPTRSQCNIMPRRTSRGPASSNEITTALNFWHSARTNSHASSSTPCRYKTSQRSRITE